MKSANPSPKVGSRLRPLSNLLDVFARPLKGLLDALQKAIDMPKNVLKKQQKAFRRFSKSLNKSSYKAGEGSNNKRNNKHRKRTMLTLSNEHQRKNDRDQNTARQAKAQTIGAGISAVGNVASSGVGAM